MMLRILNGLNELAYLFEIVLWRRKNPGYLIFNKTSDKIKISIN